MSNKKLILLCSLVSCLFIFIAQNAMAGADWKEKQEQMFAQIPVKPGDVVDRSSWEKAKGLLPEQVLEMVKAGDWILKIGEYGHDCDYTEAYYELSAKNKGKYGLGSKKEIIDLATGEYPMFVRGMPFPDVDVKNDPDGAIKYMFNNNLNIDICVSQQGRSYPEKGNLQWINRKSGYERGVGFLSQRNFWWNRFGGEIPNPRKLKFTVVNIVTFPYDLHGTNTLYYRHLDGRADSMYTYVPAIRRVKRLSGANRSDPQMGSDMTMDDSQGFNGHIESMKWAYVGEKVMLKPQWSRDAKHPRKLNKIKNGAWNWPSMGDDSCDMGFEEGGWSGVPWAYTNLVFIPREMYVFKMEPLNPYYVYGVHEIYLDKLTTQVSYSMKYTRAGEFWKSVIIALGPVEWRDGEKWFSMDGPMSIVDHKTDHASNLDIDDNNQHYASPMIDPRHHTPQNIRTMGK